MPIFQPYDAVALGDISAIGLHRPDMLAVILAFDAPPHSDDPPLG